MSLKGLSLFSSAGIGEMYLKDIDVDIIAANELIEKRAELYKHIHPFSKMITGDIKEKYIKRMILDAISHELDILIATPPCQGLSSLGKNKKQEHFELDERNYLIFDIFYFIDKLDFNYILIENVPKFLEMYFPYNNSIAKLDEILKSKYQRDYNIDIRILDAKHFGVPQSRPRAVIRMYKKGLTWKLPVQEDILTLRDAIGHLPSLESGENSNIPWHFAKKHNDRALEALRHTPTGQSAFKNKTYYPKKENGEKIKGFHNTYKRLHWDQPCHARTTYCGSISSHNNVHPGRKNVDGTFSDARVLTLLETFIVSSLPPSPSFPNNLSDSFIRTMIGESIPPLMLKKIINGIVR